MRPELTRALSSSDERHAVERILAPFWVPRERTEPAEVVRLDDRRATTKRPPERGPSR